MRTYHANMRGEDGMEFVATIQAGNAFLAELALTEDYPESSILDLRTEQERQQEAYDLW